ncbi:small kinetochore-associated protein [Pelodytes ibericus]
MEKSKIPVFKTQATNEPEKPTFTDTVVPCSKKPYHQKPAQQYSRDPNIAFSINAPDMGIFKAVNNGKKTVSKRPVAPVRGPVGRYRVDSDLRDKVQLLQAANVSLHSNLSSAQETIKEITGSQELQQKEIQELKLRLEKNLIILESRNIDPVSGESILASAKDTMQLRTDTKCHTDQLVNELQLFSQMAGEQKTCIQSLLSTWRDVADDRIQFVEEQKAFQEEMEQFRVSLQEAVQWLDM